MLTLTSFSILISVLTTRRERTTDVSKHGTNLALHSCSRTAAKQACVQSSCIYVFVYYLYLILHIKNELQRILSKKARACVKVSMLAKLVGNASSLGIFYGVLSIKLSFNFSVATKLLTSFNSVFCNL